MFFLFYESCLRRVHQAQIWVALKKLGTAALAIQACAVDFF